MNGSSFTTTVCMWELNTLSHKTKAYPPPIIHTVYYTVKMKVFEIPVNESDKIQKEKILKEQKVQKNDNLHQKVKTFFFKKTVKCV